MHVLERSVATAENGQKESRWNRAMVNRMKAPWKWMCVCFVFCSFWFILSLPYPQFLEQYLVDSLPSVNIFLMNVKGREIDVDIDDLFGGYLPIWEVVLLIDLFFLQDQLRRHHSGFRTRARVWPHLQEKSAPVWVPVSKEGLCQFLSRTFVS